MTDSDRKVETPRPSEFTNWKRFMAEETTLKISLLNGETITGTALWFDKFNFGISSEEHGEIIVPKHSVLWYGKA